MNIPRPQVSMPLLWYPDGDPHADPLACICTDVGETCIAVNVLDSCTFNTYPRDGVRHVSLSKGIPMEQLHSSGGWAYPEWLKTVLELMTPNQAPNQKAVTK